MEKDKEKTTDLVIKDKMNRREFFVSTAKTVIPTIGLLGLTLAGLNNVKPMYGCESCTGTCYGGCAGNCYGSCSYSCSGTSG